MRATVAPRLVVSSPKQPCCQEALLIPTSSTRSLTWRSTGPPASPLQILSCSLVPSTLREVPSTASTEKVPVWGVSGVHSVAVRP